MPQARTEAQLSTVHAFVRAINTSDVSGIASLLSDESFTHRYMPSTMGPEAIGSRNKEETLAVFKGTFDNVVEHMGVRASESTQYCGSSSLLASQIAIKETVQSQDHIVILVCFVP